MHGSTQRVVPKLHLLLPHLGIAAQVETETKVRQRFITSCFQALTGA
jgi:hypothetical protein